jgi:N-carbamoylputrescine amidase
VANNLKFSVALVQMAVSRKPEENLATATARIEEAAKNGAQVVCLPELFQSQYFCQREDTRNFDLAEAVPGPSTDALGRVAQKTRTVIIAPLFERRAAGVYHNTAAIIDADGKIAGIYRKMHIPDDPAYYEKFYFTPGDLGFRAFNTQAGKIATLICWDQWYPEGARLAALHGAVILFYPTAIGWHPSEKAANGEAQRDSWRTIQRGHAIANGIYVAAVNRVGHETPAEGGDGLEFLKMCAAIGRFSAIAALTLTTVSSSGFSTKNLESTPFSKTALRMDFTRCSWLFHACRMGATRRHLDRMAP